MNINFREEIASCMEAGYKRILFAEAGNMLYFKTKEELINFAKEVFSKLKFYKTFFFLVKCFKSF